MNRQSPLKGDYIWFVSWMSGSVITVQIMKYVNNYCLYNVCNWNNIYWNDFSWDAINNTSSETHLEECSAFHQKCYTRYHYNHLSSKRVN